MLKNFAKKRFFQKKFWRAWGRARTLKTFLERRRRFFEHFHAISSQKLVKTGQKQVKIGENPPPKNEIPAKVDLDPPPLVVQL